jgi:hypothetical protein
VLALGIAATAVIRAALYAITLAIGIAIDVGIAASPHRPHRAARATLVPELNHAGLAEGFNIKSLWASSLLATFTMGALPAGALAYATSSVAAVERAINEHLAAHNQSAKPFMWTAAADSSSTKSSRLIQRTRETQDWRAFQNARPVRK